MGFMRRLDGWMSSPPSRLIILSPETPDSEMRQRHVIHTPEETRRLGEAVTATVMHYRNDPNPQETLARLVALDAVTPPFDFELA